MIVFLDANPVIYFVEQPPVWGTVAIARIAALRAAGDRLAVSDLVRMECQVGPLKAGDAVRLNDFLAFFASRDVNVLPVTAAVCDRAARIRATHNLKPLDSLHLAAAVEHGCGRFLTADARLAGFPDIAVEILT
jgi:predicted nucleic acid-binding protein